jgi:predicted nucleic acid-binding protein
MVLIHLTKLGKIEEKCEIFKEIFIPEAVKNELLYDTDKYLDAKIIESLLNEDKIKVKEADVNQINMLRAFKFEGGELEALALALSNPGSVLFSNDPKLRYIANLFNIKLIDTMAVLISEYKNKLDTKEQLLEYLFKLKKISKYAENYVNGIIKLVEMGFFD